MSFGLPVVVLFERTICLFWVWESSPCWDRGVGLFGWLKLGGFPLVFWWTILVFCERMWISNEHGFDQYLYREERVIALRRAVCFLCQSPLLYTLLTPFTCPRPDRLYSAAILNRNNRIPCLHLSQVQRLGLLSLSLLLAYGNQIVYTLQRIPVLGAMNLFPGL